MQVTLRLDGTVRNSNLYHASETYITGQPHLDIKHLKLSKHSHQQRDSSYPIHHWPPLPTLPHLTSLAIRRLSLVHPTPLHHCTTPTLTLPPLIMANGYVAPSPFPHFPPTLPSQQPLTYSPPSAQRKPNNRPRLRHRLLPPRILLRAQRREPDVCPPQATATHLPPKAQEYGSPRLLRSGDADVSLCDYV